MASPEAAGPSAPAEEHPLSLWLTRSASAVAAAVTLAMVVAFVKEYLVLRGEEGKVASTAVVGYVGIHPNLSYARPPVPWYQAEGAGGRLWGGWDKAAGKSVWFPIGPGQLDPKTIGSPLGRDVFPAIDYPVEESAGGLIWRRVPDDAEVAGFRLGGVETAYPVIVLDKMGLANDTVGGQPFLITYNAKGQGPLKAAVYEREVDGKALNFGHSGYYRLDEPLYFDRGTESLWTVEEEGLVAVSGPRNGQRLKRLQRPSPVPWSQWRSEHPRGRLVVGADRNKPRPTL